MQLLERNFAGTETDDGDFRPFEPERFIPDREELLPLPPIPVPAEEQRTIDPEAVEIEDEALNAAANDYRAASKSKASERGSWAAALGLALFIHAGFVAACLVLALMYKLWLPRLELTQGAGSSESGLVADDATATTSTQGGMPGPAVAVPNPAKPLKMDRPSEMNDTTSEPETAETTTLRATAKELESPTDRVLIGLATNCVGPMPVWPHAALHKSPTSAQASGANSTTIVAPQNRAIAAKHLFVAPRGLGGVASGNQGSGLDSRGLPVPEYPAESRRCHEEGIVAFQVQVKSDGSVGTINLAKDSGFPRLNHAAFVSLQTARFTPATEDGKPIATTVIVPYRFILR